mmetsp:Transcript_5574/g.18542  ORF Transcript_5574/g.18542 Transcript_5574/m.18542 type:complete len:220 (-) Transcript_5574:541-1200(-)
MIWNAIRACALRAPVGILWALFLEREVEDGRGPVDLSRLVVVGARCGLLVVEVADGLVRPIQLDPRLPPTVPLAHTTVCRRAHHGCGRGLRSARRLAGHPIPILLVLVGARLLRVGRAGCHRRSAGPLARRARFGHVLVAALPPLGLHRPPQLHRHEFGHVGVGSGQRLGGPDTRGVHARLERAAHLLDHVPPRFRLVLRFANVFIQLLGDGLGRQRRR